MTRNPMYLGFALVLAAWTVFLTPPFALLGIAAFILYINRFQILPEERALRRLFGDDLDEYYPRVRRWIRSAVFACRFANLTNPAVHDLGDSLVSEAQWPSSPQCSPAVAAHCPWKALDETHGRRHLRKITAQFA